MKHKLLLVFFLLPFNIFGQSGEWDTLRTDDGEFSMKMPAGCHRNFYDPNGIVIRAKNGGVHHLKEMRVITCFRDRTLLDVEIYKSAQPRLVVNALISQNSKTSPRVSQDGEYYWARTFEASKSRVYMITTATRDTSNADNNPIRRTFLDSLRFAFDDKDRSRDPAEKFTAISTLKNFTPELIYETDQPQIPRADQDKDDPLLKKAIVLNLAKISYSNAVRRSRNAGGIKIRLTLGADAVVNQIRVIEGLRDNKLLLREAVIAAFRTKFLPEEYDGIPRSSSQTIEYRFNSYPR